MFTQQIARETPNYFGMVNSLLYFFIILRGKLLFSVTFCVLSEGTSEYFVQIFGNQSTIEHIDTDVCGGIIEARNTESSDLSRLSGNQYGLFGDFSVKAATRNIR